MEVGERSGGIKISRSAKKQQKEIKFSRTNKKGNKMDSCQENCIEFLTNQKVMCVSFSQKKWVNRINKLAKDHPEVEIVAENTDGSVTAHVPISWLKISPKRPGREFTEEEKMAAAERLEKARQKKREEMANGRS